MASVDRLRTPPHSIEAEQSLLGALMLEPKAWARIAPLVTDEDLYRGDHRLIFTAIGRLQAAGQAADGVTVVAWLHRAGQLEAAGGREYIARLVADTPSAANIEAYAHIVRDRATR